jgi:hypothetical protein
VSIVFFDAPDTDESREISIVDRRTWRREPPTREEQFAAAQLRWATTFVDLDA